MPEELIGGGFGGNDGGGQPPAAPPESQGQPSAGGQPRDGQPPSGGDPQMGTWPREAQAEFTRRTQQIADERRQWEQERQQYQQQQQTWQQQQKAYAQALYTLLARAGQANGQQQQQGHGQQQQTDRFGNVREMPYVDGQTLVQTLEQMRQDLAQAGVQPQQLQQVTSAMNLLMRQNADLKKQVEGITTDRRMGDFESTIEKTRQQFKLPEHSGEWLKDIYLSYEPGPDLDREFPNIVRERLESLRKTVRDLDRQEASAARAARFPGRGGAVSPSGPLQEEFKPAREVAKELWASFQSAPRT
jgi:hypothetical protein